ncbi:glucosaminidase domain-containing protein [Helcococcus ovis]|uniref:Mannosyl-glycoprotein endo-beta-N-acetylglucosamidase-like domain-containing protein n=1 Tax=Helcococcus ovis TaxID=72026 RepID=A0A4R9C3K4_9FIRM|nr:glucosaminidase domain-containing protein [Helcococcus ovis]TFF65632.1 hypothetical protein EQF92_01895 [Helcococcus ovis]TFF67514.1 hypothetical protein EQF91_00930 [Helcococcus ovis]
MNLKKIIKIGGLATFATAIAFAGSFASKAGNTYKLVNTVDGYYTSYNAKYKTEAKLKYSAGDYYVYNEYDGMINITKNPNYPGAWINPKDNKTVVAKEEVAYAESGESSENTDSIGYINDDNMFVLNKNVKVYYSDYEAKHKLNPRMTFSEGTYYIFSRSRGMINITQYKGVPGGWIDPSEVGSVKKDKTSKVKENVKNERSSTNANSEIPFETTFSKYSSYPVKVNLEGYDTVEAAKNYGQSTVTFEPGDYYIIGTSQNMIKLGFDYSGEGYWVNPNSNNVRDTNYQTSRPQEFIDKIASYAVKATKGRDVYTSVMMAQTILETGYGKSTLSSVPYHNMFGIKGTYDGASVVIPTFEYDSNGKSYNVLSEFRKYPSYLESFQDYVNLITGYEDSSNWSYSYYYGARKSQTNSYKDATRYLSRTYATSPIYAETLNNIIELYDLTQYDN